VYAYAKFNAPLCGHLRIATDHPSLNFHRATRGAYSTRELNQNPITRPLNNAASMFGDLGLQKFPPMHVETRQSVLFVGTHYPAVASNVTCEDGRKTPLCSLLGHFNRPRV
jgi:hypothetical protein